MIAIMSTILISRMILLKTPLSLLPLLPLHPEVKEVIVGEVGVQAVVVQVISPLLLRGKTKGMTTLILFCK